jgi:signal transduction histidine kinase
MSRSTSGEGVGRDPRSFVDDFPDALIVVTPDGRVVSWSGGAERMFGFTADEAVGRVLPEPRGDVTVYETTRLRKDGSSMIVDATVRAIRGADGAIELLAISEKDVTSRREAERRKAAERAELLAKASHDLRTPLNAIIGFAKLMRGGTVGPVSDDHREYLADILTSASQLLEVTDRVLALSGVEGGEATP